MNIAYPNKLPTTIPIETETLIACLGIAIGRVTVAEIHALARSSTTGISSLYPFITAIAEHDPMEIDASGWDATARPIPGSGPMEMDDYDNNGSNYGDPRRGGRRQRKSRGWGVEAAVAPLQQPGPVVLRREDRFE